jgi:hypothetical protein
LDIPVPNFAVLRQAELMAGIRLGVEIETDTGLAVTNAGPSNILWASLTGRLSRRTGH